MLSHGLPLLSFTLNTPGDIKDSPAIRRFFAVWLDRIREALGGKIVEEKARYPKTGPEYLAALRGDARGIKRICVAIEESRPAGRLLDLDVIGTEGTSLSRTGLGFPERKCLICGKPGRACGAGQRHSYKALTEKAGALIRGYLVERDAERLGEKATNALIREVHVTPKPGLVDENNSGSHGDMDLSLMEKSARALTPYFMQCVRIGMETASLLPEESFPPLREAGKEAEKAMFAATGGVNTHKGAVYLFGILLGAVGRLWKPEGLPAPEAFLMEAGRIAEKAVKEDLNEIARLPEGSLTAGQRIYRQYGLAGARGEAAAGFPALRETVLPYLAAHRGEEDAYVRVLLRIIARGTDTNLIARGGKEGADRAVKAAEDLLEKGEPRRAEIEALDQEFIRQNLSPGGSADLLALALFCEELRRSK